MLGPVAFDGGRTLDLSVGIGSGAFRGPSDPPNEFFTVSDRGPNFTCGDAEDIIGLKGERICGDIKRGRIYPRPEYSPTIYRVAVGTDGHFRVIGRIPLKDAKGNPVDGLPNPLTVAGTENPVDAKGLKLKPNPNAVDAEGLVHLSDGSFWIGEENAPSIFQADAEGRIQVRHVPAGTEKDFAGAGYEIRGTLPAILARRALNRGIESLSVSDDEKFFERTDRTTKFFEVDLAGATDIKGSVWDESATRPSLEQSDLDQAGIRPVAKKLVLDSVDHPEMPGKIEGMARFGDGSLMLINDDDFGIEGARTRIMKVGGLSLGR
jgi:hypothetical protein